MIRLIIDDRERAIFPHLDLEALEYQGINHTIARCTVGDYSVVCGQTLLAVFERKTYEDFASSIKDGRHANKQNLLDARKDTGCQVYYIVEGKAFPRDVDTFARIPYRIIESAIDHLVIRDRINILYTRDTQHTTVRLARFVKSMETLYRAGDLPLDNQAGLTLLLAAQLAAQLAGGEPKADEMLIQPIPAILTAKKEINPLDVVREMWSKFRGISTITADTFINKYSVGEVVRKIATAQELAATKSANGKSISKRVIESLTHVAKSDEVKLLSTIPGISAVTAKEIIEQHRLSDLLSYEPEVIGIIRVGKNKTKIGEDKAKRILHFFSFTNRPKDAPAAEQNEKDEKQIIDFLEEI